MVALTTSLTTYPAHTQNYGCLHWKSSVGKDCKVKSCSVNNTFRAFFKSLSHKIAPAFDMDFPIIPQLSQCVHNFIRKCNTGAIELMFLNLSEL